MPAKTIRSPQDYVDRELFSLENQARREHQWLVERFTAPQLDLEQWRAMRSIKAALVWARNYHGVIA